MLRPTNQTVSFKQQKDPGLDGDYSVEFKSGFVDPYASNNIIDTSGPLWGPGIRVQQTPALTSEKLEMWRNYGEQPKSINAAAELDKLYASLPDDKLDLTLKDLVEGRRVSPRVTPAKHGDSMTIGAILGRNSTKAVKRGAAKEDGGKFKPKNQVHNNPSIALPFRLPNISPKRDKSSPAIPIASPNRQSLSSHFTAEERVLSPRNINAGSSASFSVDSDLGSVTIGDELGKSRAPDLQHSETSDSVDPLTLREQLSRPSEGPKSSRRHSVAQAHDCSICSASNLFFKTRCTVCGKTYCSKCAKKAMLSLPDGRKCQKTCVGRPPQARFAKKSGVGCWPLFGFSNNHAAVAETTATMRGQRQDGPRLQEFDLQRKSSSYPPSRSPTQRVSPRRSTERVSPRQSTDRVSVSHHAFHYTLPTAPMAVS